MKKIALLPLAALMLAFASCSDDKEPARPAVPNDQVVTVESVADQVTIDAPEQYLDYEYDDGVYEFTYANGQKLTFAMYNSPSLGLVAVVKRIKGDEVVIPANVKAIRQSTGEEQTYRIVALDLYQDGVSETVKKVTIAKEVCWIYSTSTSSVEPITNEKMAVEISKMKNVEDVELETGFPGLCSIDGAVYTEDYKTLVAVPHGKTGIFTIAEDTEVVAEHALAYCSKLIAVTFPKAVNTIEDEAVINNDMLVLINMMPATAPSTQPNTFGRMARTSVLRIPVGSKDSYFPAKPDVTEPVPPVEPDDDASFEDWDNYYEAEMIYNEQLAVYETVMSVYTRPIGFRKFTNVEEVNF